MRTSKASEKEITKIENITQNPKWQNLPKNLKRYKNNKMIKQLQIQTKNATQK